MRVQRLPQVQVQLALAHLLVAEGLHERLRQRFGRLSGSASAAVGSWPSRGLMIERIGELASEFKPLPDDEETAALGATRPRRPRHRRGWGGWRRELSAQGALERDFVFARLEMDAVGTARRRPRAEPVASANTGRRDGERSRGVGSSTLESIPELVGEPVKTPPVRLAEYGNRRKGIVGVREASSGDGAGGDGRVRSGCRDSTLVGRRRSVPRRRSDE
jgi:hypothetical protein